MEVAIKEEIVKKDGKNGIAVEGISARLVEARNFYYNNNFCYVRGSLRPECYMAVLDSTVASLPAREYVFVLTDAQDKEER